MERKKKLTKLQKRRLELGITLFSTIFVIALWNSFIIYPVKLFVVLIHEVSHAIVAILSGGSVASLSINNNLGGDTSIVGGIPFLIASAGYLGSSIVGAMLFISSYSKKYRVFIAPILGVIIMLTTINLVTDNFTIVFALTASAILLFSNSLFPDRINFYFLRIIGLISSLYAIIDIKEDTLTSNFNISDAQILEALTGVNYIIWGLSWFMISIFILYFLFKESYKKGF